MGDSGAPQHRQALFGLPLSETQAGVPNAKLNSLRTQVFKYQGEVRYRPNCAPLALRFSPSVFVTGSARESVLPSARLSLLPAIDADLRVRFHRVADVVDGPDIGESGCEVRGGVEESVRERLDRVPDIIPCLLVRCDSRFGVHRRQVRAPVERLELRHRLLDLDVDRVDRLRTTAFPERGDCIKEVDQMLFE